MMPTGQLEGDHAIVTGAARGIGAAIARALSAAGARVTLVDLRAESLELVAAECNGPKVHIVAADVSDEMAVRQLCREAQAQWPVSILVNQAGVIPRGALADTTLETWNATQAVNVTSMFLMCREIAPAMAERGEGRIVNCASGASFAAGRELPAYTASKGAVLSLTRALAVDFGPAVRANALCPGLIDTAGPLEAPGADAGLDLRRQTAASRTPLGRLGTAEEVAAGALFLVSPASSFCTGTALIMDGGALAAS